MKIVRLHIECEQDPSEMIVFKENTLWEYIINESKNWVSEKIKPLYLTQRSVPGHDEISLIIDVDNLDSLGDFILDKIVPIDCVRDIWVINFMQPRFFTVPKNTDPCIKRFTISIDANPSEYSAIFNFISKIKPSRSVIVTYLAYTFHEYGDDILISVLAQGKSTVDAFVDNFIMPIEGVNGTKITRITKTKLLTTLEDWKIFSSPFTKIDKNVDIAELDNLFEEDFIAGC
jgi:hypothetical protein